MPTKTETKPKAETKASSEPNEKPQAKPAPAKKAGPLERLGIDASNLGYKAAPKPPSKTNAIRIEKLPFTIDQSDTYYCLARSIFLPKGQSGIAVMPDISNIIIDLCGYGIFTEADEKSLGIAINATNTNNITVKNGTIEGFYIGVRIDSNGENIKIEDLLLDKCTFRGMWIHGNNTTIANNTIFNCGGHKIHEKNFCMGIELWAGDNCLIENNLITEFYAIGAGAEAVGISVSDKSNNTLISHNAIFNTDYPKDETRSAGVWIGGETDIAIYGNRFDGLSIGIWVCGDSQAGLLENKFGFVQAKQLFV